MSLGDNIKRCRKLNNLTQEELAKIVGMSKTTVVLWEKGERDPQTKELKKLSDYFNDGIHTYRK